MTWVTVKVAAEDLGTSESRIRLAYRNGKLTVRDEVVGGRARKLVALEEARAWSGLPTAPVAEADGPARPIVAAVAAKVAPPRAPVAPVVTAPTTEVPDRRIDSLTELAEQALAKSDRAEAQLAYLRNELAQLRESHLRIQEDYDRRSAEQFRASARLACTTAKSRPDRRGGVRRLLVWRTSA